MPQVSTWDASKLAIALGAISLESGFSDGSFVKYTPDDGYFGFKKGGDGTVTRFRIPGKVGKVALTVEQSSVTNDLLSARLNADHNTTNGLISSFQMKDLNGTTLIQAAHAWIEGPPTAEFGVESNQREWTIVLADAVVFFGGNPPQ